MRVTKKLITVIYWKKIDYVVDFTQNPKQNSWMWWDCVSLLYFFYLKLNICDKKYLRHKRLKTETCLHHLLQLDDILRKTTTTYLRTHWISSIFLMCTSWNVGGNFRFVNEELVDFLWVGMRYWIELFSFRQNYQLAFRFSLDTFNYCDCCDFNNFVFCGDWLSSKTIDSGLKLKYLVLKVVQPYVFSTEPH